MRRAAALALHFRTGSEAGRRAGHTLNSRASTGGYGHVIGRRTRGRGHEVVALLVELTRVAPTGQCRQRLALADRREVGTAERHVVVLPGGVSAPRSRRRRRTSQGQCRPGRNAPRMRRAEDGSGRSPPAGDPSRCGPGSNQKPAAAHVCKRDLCATHPLPVPRLTSCMRIHGATRGCVTPP